MRVTDEMVEALAKWLHDEVEWPEYNYPERSWPEHEGDTGQRGDGWLKIVPPDVCEQFRDIARRLPIEAALAVEWAEAVAQTSLNHLRQANVARQAAWCPEQVPDLSFRGCELAGEVGEALNVIKKLERERLGWRGSRDTVEHLAEELADVVICADLVALSAGIDLDAAVIAKFNATSEKVGLPHRLEPTTTPPAGIREALINLNAELDAMWNTPADQRVQDGQINSVLVQNITNAQIACARALRGQS